MTLDFLTINSVRSNIKGLHHQVAKIYGLENQSLLRKLNVHTLKSFT